MAGDKGRGRMLRMTSAYLVPGLLAVLVAMPAAQASNNNEDMATFKATILPGTCSLELDSKKSVLDLQSVSSGSVVTGRSLLDSDKDPQVLDVSCNGYPADASMPSLTVTGTDIAAGSPSLFRDVQGGDNPSVSLGFRVQAALIGTAPTDWSAIDYMDSGTAIPVDTDKGHDANGAQIPVRFTLWCVPTGGRTVTDCQSGGKVKANVSFTLDYK